MHGRYGLSIQKTFDYPTICLRVSVLKYNFLLHSWGGYKGQSKSSCIGVFLQLDEEADHVQLVHNAFQIKVSSTPIKVTVK